MEKRMETAFKANSNPQHTPAAKTLHDQGHVKVSGVGSFQD